jgi:hypothetical protein
MMLVSGQVTLLVDQLLIYNIFSALLRVLHTSLG